MFIHKIKFFFKTIYNFIKKLTIISSNFHTKLCQLIFSTWFGVFKPGSLVMTNNNKGWV